MRVAIVTESFLPAVNGVTTSVCRVVEQLVDRGHDVRVVAPRSRDGGPHLFHGARVHRVASVPVRSFDVGLPTREVERVLDGFSPDVVHAASPFALGAAGLAAARRLRLPSVAVFQTDMAAYVRRHTPGPAGARAAATTWRWIRRVHAAADLTLAPSSASLADLAAHGVGPARLWGRGVDASLHHPDWRRDALTRALRRELAPGGERLVGYVGRLAPEKEVERLATLADLPGTRLVVVGDGPSRSGLAELLGRAAAGAGRGRAVASPPPAFLGERHGDDLARAYAALDVFVHTGTSETFGQTLQEAGATALPVVAPRAGGPIDLVDDGVDGHLFDPEAAAGHRDSLRERVARVLAEPDHAAAIGARAHARVRARSWSAVVDQLEGHYAAALHAAAASARRAA